MKPEVALTPTCAECGDVWLPADRDRWRLHLDVDDELVWLCAECMSVSSAASDRCAMHGPR
jgi:RNase P subunit RPR2